MKLRIALRVTRPGPLPRRQPRGQARTMRRRARESSPPPRSARRVARSKELAGDTRYDRLGEPAHGCRCHGPPSAERARSNRARGDPPVGQHEASQAASQSAMSRLGHVLVLPEDGIAPWARLPAPPDVRHVGKDFAHDRDPGRPSPPQSRAPLRAAGRRPCSGGRGRETGRAAPAGGRAPAAPPAEGRRPPRASRTAAARGERARAGNRRFRAWRLSSEWTTKA